MSSTGVRNKAKKRGGEEEEGKGNVSILRTGLGIRSILRRIIERKHLAGLISPRVFDQIQF